MKNINDWNKEYASYHINPVNKAIHWICIPLIIFSLFGLLSIISLKILVIFIALTLGYYLRLSRNLAIGMLAISILFTEIINNINLNTNLNLLYLYLGIFTIAWAGQFIGHKFEGKKPAFFKDLQFLLIGPLWLLSYIYNKLNIEI